VTLIKNGKEGGCLCLGKCKIQIVEIKMHQQQDKDSKVELYRLSKIKHSTTNKNSKILLIE
jgi:hypothetical protein